MAFDKYKDGAWQEPESGVKRYESGAWTDCESAKRYKDGAWEEVWVAQKRLYYFRNGAFENGSSIYVGSKSGVYDEYEIDGTLNVTVNNGGNSTVKIYLPELLSYQGKTFVIEGEFTADTHVRLEYMAASGSYSSQSISRYKDVTEASITIPTSTYTGTNKPYLEVYGKDADASYTVKFSKIYIIEE